MKIMEVLTSTASVVALTATVGASAATVTDISSTITNTGTTTTEVYSNTSTGTAAQTITGNASFGFTDSFNQSGNITTGSDFGATATGAGGPWNFQDNIALTTTSVSVQLSAIATLTNVTDLQIRLISLSNPANGTSFSLASGSPDAAALVGGSTVATIINGWTNFAAPTVGVDYTATLATAIAPGNYVIQIRGEAAASSTYSGTATFTAVPLPATAWLLLSGLGGAMGWARRRSLTA